MITGTLLKASWLCVSAGFAWALLAAAAIYLASTRFSPKIAHGRVWADWRRKRMVWGGALVLSAVGALLTAEGVVRGVTAHDLYWQVRASDLLMICRLGALTGFLTVLLLATLGSMILRRRGAAAPQRSRARS